MMVKKMLNKLMSREGRKYIYLISVTVIPLLVFYGVISEDAAPLWVALVAAIVAPMTALTHLSPEEPVE
jgi:hypothetical protein